MIAMMLDQQQGVTQILPDHSPMTRLGKVTDIPNHLYRACTQLIFSSSSTGRHILQLSLLVQQGSFNSDSGLPVRSFASSRITSVAMDEMDGLTRPGRAAGPTW